MLELAIIHIDEFELLCTHAHASADDGGSLIFQSFTAAARQPGAFAAPNLAGPLSKCPDPDHRKGCIGKPAACQAARPPRYQ